MEIWPSFDHQLLLIPPGWKQVFFSSPLVIIIFEKFFFSFSETENSCQDMEGWDILIFCLYDRFLRLFTVFFNNDGFLLTTPRDCKQYFLSHCTWELFWSIPLWTGGIPGSVSLSFDTFEQGGFAVIHNDLSYNIHPPFFILSYSFVQFWNILTHHFIECWRLQAPAPLLLNHPDCSYIFWGSVSGSAMHRTLQSTVTLPSQVMCPGNSFPMTQARGKKGSLSLHCF